MNSNMMAVIKKEFTRFFTDKRMVLTTLIMPGLMIYLLYSVMGQGLSSQFAGGDEKPKAQVVSLPASMGSMGPWTLWQKGAEITSFWYASRKILTRK